MHIRKKRLALYVLLLFLVAVGIRAYFVLGPSGDRPIEFTLSKETTYITEPLDADGVPDYLAYLDAKTRTGITPENNAAVLLLEVLNLEDTSPNLRPHFFETLGISKPVSNLHRDGRRTSPQSLTVYRTWSRGSTLPRS